jgi:hypothetical protein
MKIRKWFVKNGFILPSAEKVQQFLISLQYCLLYRRLHQIQNCQNNQTSTIRDQLAYGLNQGFYLIVCRLNK